MHFYLFYSLQVRISEMLLGKVPDGFTFAPKHKSNSYDRAENGWFSVASWCSRVWTRPLSCPCGWTRSNLFASCLIHYMQIILTEVCPDLGVKKEKPTVHNSKFSLGANLSIDPWILKLLYWCYAIILILKIFILYWYKVVACNWNLSTAAFVILPICFPWRKRKIEKRRVKMNFICLQWEIA